MRDLQTYGEMLAPEIRCCGDSQGGFEFLCCEVGEVVSKAIGGIVWIAGRYRGSTGILRDAFVAGSLRRVSCHVFTIQARGLVSTQRHRFARIQWLMVSARAMLGVQSGAGMP